MRFSCRFFGPRRKFSVGEFATDAEAYFRAILPMTGGFDERLLCAGPDNDPGDPVAPNLADLRATIVRNLYVGRHRYEAPSGEMIDPPNESSFGPHYILGLMNSRGSWDKPSHVDIHLGGRGFGTPSRSDSKIIWTFHPDGTGHRLTGYPSIRDFMEATIDFRHPERANCTTDAFRRATGFDRSTDKFDVGWLTYFDDPAYGDAVASVANVEPLGQGALIRVCDDFRDLETEDVVARGSLVRQTLIRKGLMTK